MRPGAGEEVGFRGECYNQLPSISSQGPRASHPPAPPACDAPGCSWWTAPGRASRRRRRCEARVARRADGAPGARAQGRMRRQPCRWVPAHRSRVGERSPVLQLPGQLPELLQLLAVEPAAGARGAGAASLAPLAVQVGVDLEAAEVLRCRRIGDRGSSRMVTCSGARLPALDRGCRVAGAAAEVAQALLCCVQGHRQAGTAPHGIAAHVGARRWLAAGRQPQARPRSGLVAGGGAHAACLRMHDGCSTAAGLPRSG
jgi:hypothetical protein